MTSVNTKSQEEGISTIQSQTSNLKRTISLKFKDKSLTIKYKSGAVDFTENLLHNQYESRKVKILALLLK